MDSLERFFEIENINIDNFDIGTRSWVSITHVNNPSSFYIRKRELKTVMQKLAVPGSVHKNSDIQFGLLVVFMSKTIKNYARGNICYIDFSTKTYDLFAVDYGFFEKSVELKNIFQLQSPPIPPLAIHCQLADCKPIGSGTWTKREVDAFKNYINYIDDERAIALVRDKTPEILTVQLFNSSPDDIATLMALTGYSQLGYGSNKIGKLTGPPVQKLYFKFKQLEINTILKVRLQCGKELNNFFVATKEDYKTYLKEQEIFTLFTKKLDTVKPDDLKENMPVAVFTELYKKYERGIVKEIVSETRVKVQLIDWGKIEEYYIYSLKPMSDKFYHNPAIAIFCSVNSEQMTDYRLLKCMYQGYEFSIKIKELGEHFEKPNIVEIIPSC